MKWAFLPADAPSKKSTSEALVKSMKKVITVVVGGSVMIFFNLQTMCHEAANLVNERPISKAFSPEEFPVVPSERQGD